MKLPAESGQRSELAVVLLIAAVQFVNILDFLMVAPLGRDFAVPLGFSESKVGLLTGSYTAAAAVSGFAGSFFLDRFDRRAALRATLFGLACGTAAGGLARNLHELMLARVVAGCFGGPATSVALAVIADVVPPARRGKAMGMVMGALSLAQVLGVPGGLALARLGGWRMPFFGVAALAVVTTMAATVLLPPLRGHLAARAQEPPPTLRQLVGRPTVRLSYLMTATVMVSGFLIVPNLPVYVQTNLRFPRERLDEIYLVAGVAGFVTMQLIGRLVDRFGSFRVGSVMALAWLPVAWFGFIAWRPDIPVYALFIAFSVTLSGRNVAYGALTSKVPAPRERARFMSIQSTVQHLASSVGAIGSSFLVYSRPDGTLGGMERLAILSMLFTAALPPLFRAVERRVARSLPDKSSPAPNPTAAPPH